MKIYKYKIYGVVQGVGFRPFVFKLAKKINIRGAVRNEKSGACIFIKASKKNAELFLERLKKNAPSLIEILKVSEKAVNKKEAAWLNKNLNGKENFKIMSSDKSSDKKEEISIIPHDIAICPDCEKDFFNENNARYKYPFISCQLCGPRYSIINKFPYDRKNTSMNEFKMCNFCMNEYENPDNRRFHAQTISCYNCSPKLLVLKKKQNLPLENIFLMSKIFLVKGISGYHLVCNPEKITIVRKLRKIKNRDAKPFALMFKNISEIKNYCIISKEEKSALKSSIKPIVLLKIRRRLKEGNFIKNKNLRKEIINDSEYIGAMLPSMGLHYLLLEKKSPLIFTSANISGEPVLSDDEKAKKMFENFPDIDIMLYNKRKIIIGQDDSVVKFMDKKMQIIRRAKGFAPIPIYIGKINKAEVFAAGADMKSAFAFYKNDFAYLSQFLGEFSNEEILSQEKNYVESFMNFKKLFHFKPKYFITDMHPKYKSKKLIKDISEKNIKIIEVQHHIAHIASVIVEHNIKEDIIGVAFDGTGFGTDGNIWGGEIFTFKNKKWDRFSHLKYVKIEGGDIASKYTSIPAAAYLTDYRKKNEDEFEIDIKEIKAYYKNSKIMLTKKISHLSSSIGRLFDAVSYLLNICKENKYEAQAAIKLENYANRAFEKYGINKSINSKRLEKFIIRNNTKSKKEFLSLLFHFRIIETIISEAKKARSKTKINTICLSGGSFQNEILLKYTYKELSKNNFKVFTNEKIPVNDGGIALGQLLL
ncbi:MAG: carbamoyltransferase HypF [Clostridiales Family XIII bacterium]|jgi:hydrogenase maturation protein HypF|nr:carbamoyltransferase HypF [Clostridiales Family XIII bacterium]